MKAKTLGSAILCTTALLASLAGELMAQAPTTESQTSQSDVSALKAQLAEQQKQIDELKAALKEQMKLIERTASTTAPAADAQQKQDFALPRNKALGEVASASPIIPPAPAPVAPAVLSGAQGGGSKNPCEAPPDANAVPPYLRIGNVCVVPIGFLDATYVWRDKNAQSSIGTNFGSIPYNNTTNSKLSENRFARQNSRLGFRIDGDWKGVHFTNYLEFDFLGTSGASNITRYQRRFRSPPASVLGGRPQVELGISDRTKLEHADSQPQGHIRLPGRHLLLASLRRELHGGLDVDPSARLCACSTMPPTTRSPSDSRLRIPTATSVAIPVAAPSPSRVHLPGWPTPSWTRPVSCSGSSTLTPDFIAKIAIRSELSFPL